MRVGLVSLWSNRGQGVRARQIREILEGAGHETFVLARPTVGTSPRPDHIDDRPEWRQPGVAVASAFDIPIDEYTAWARGNEIDLLLANQNTQFAEIAALREAGVRTVGRFNWESFGRKQAEQVPAAYDVVYSLTRAEQYRYRVQFGLETPYVRYGIHPGLMAGAAPKRTGAVYFIFHGGLLGKRKPLVKTVEAFKRVGDSGIRLIVKSQGSRAVAEQMDVADDPRIELIEADMPDAEYAAFYSSCHVCLNPTRWEGLGMWVFESLGYGMPIISTDLPPVNEVVRHGLNGLLTRPVPIGSKRRGVPIYDPDVEDLSRLISELADPARLDEMIGTLVADRARLSWEFTKRDFLDLVEGRLG